MYSAINAQVADIGDATYLFEPDNTGKSVVTHDPRIAAAMDKIDAFRMDNYLSENLVLQHSDRDFYSLPEWNADLCERVNKASGTCHDFEYEGNTHSLSVSEHSWFSDNDSKAGFSLALQRDIAVFSGGAP